MRFISLILFVISISASAQSYETRLTVAADGSGDYTSVQDAIYAAKAFPWTDVTVFIKNGVYKEKVNVFAWNTRIKMVGESREGTIITMDDHFDKLAKGRNSTFHTYTVRVAGNDFTAANLTIRNTAGPVGQAVALHVEADRAAFYNVSIEGYQDTLYVAGEGHRSYFENSMISGSVDFIFGEGTALFSGCEIRSLISNTYVTAASTPQEQPFGLVFDNSHFTAPEGVENVYLGRPWRQFAATAVVNSQLDGHIHPAGWHNWGDPSKEQTSRYETGGNTGEGAAGSDRVDWQHSLSEQQRQSYNKATVLRGWSPEKPI